MIYNLAIETTICSAQRRHSKSYWYVRGSLSCPVCGEHHNKPPALTVACCIWGTQELRLRLLSMPSVRDIGSVVLREGGGGGRREHNFQQTNKQIQNKHAGGETTKNVASDLAMHDSFCSGCSTAVRPESTRGKESAEASSRQDGKAREP